MDNSIVSGKRALIASIGQPNTRDKLNTSFGLNIVTRISQDMGQSGDSNEENPIEDLKEKKKSVVVSSYGQKSNLYEPFALTCNKVPTELARLCKLPHSYIRAITWPLSVESRRYSRDMYKIHPSLPTCFTPYTSQVRASFSIFSRVPSPESRVLSPVALGKGEREAGVWTWTWM